MPLGIVVFPHDEVTEGKPIAPFVLKPMVVYPEPKNENENGIVVLVALSSVVGIHVARPVPPEHASSQVWAVATRV